MAGLGAALVLACGVAGLGAVPAKANCYEIYGCTDSSYFDANRLTGASCQILWEMRNWIYKENGYCFTTQRAIKAFGNAGCSHDDVASVPLNGYERANVASIKAAEREKGC
jgi:hypothetical protein